MCLRRAYKNYIVHCHAVKEFTEHFNYMAVITMFGHV